jgi:sporulation protein YlmC with PRC-barrel domain
MHVDLDARVVTSDGREVGRIKHAIIDPRDNEVMAFVVSTGWFLGRDVLIARQEIESARADGDAITLELTHAQFDDLQSFIPHEYHAPPPEYAPAAPYDSPAAAYLWPIALSGGTAPAPGPLPTTGSEAQPPGIDRGSQVVDRNGDAVGVVEDLLFDAESGALRALVVTLGGGLQRLFDAGRTAKVSASLVERVAGEVVHLRTVRAQIDANS